MTFVSTAAFAPCCPTLPSNRYKVGRKRNGFPFAFSDGLKVDTSLTAVAGGETAQVFEPVVNIPALGSFVFIAIVFSFLIMRVRQVEEAVERRKRALADLRQVKSNELASGNVAEGTVASALKEYEDALKSEDNLRTILPGVRVVAPNQSAATNEEDVAAARQFLGIDLDESSSASTTRRDEAERTGLSAGSVAVLIVVALSQLALLYMLSFDPMDAFNSFGGAPPGDLPPSSW